MTLGIGIVGAGFGAKVHQPAFAAVPGAQVRMLADGGSGRAADQVGPGVRPVSDWRRVIDDAGVDLVVVAVPPDRHAQIALAALDAGKHVLVEKPFGATAAQAQAMLERWRQGDRVGAVGFQFRHEPHLLALKAALATGIIGAVRHVAFTWLTAGRADPLTPFSWQNDQECGGGVVNAFSSHAVDLIAWLAGRPITAVAQARRQIVVPSRPTADGLRPVTAEDRVTARLALGDGVAASVDICNCRADGDGMRIAVTGEHGRLISHQRPPFRPADSSVVLETAEGARDLPIALPALWPQGDSRLGAATGLSAAIVAAAAGSGADYPDFTAGAAARRVLDSLLAAPCVGPRDKGECDD